MFKAREELIELEEKLDISRLKDLAKMEEAIECCVEIRLEKDIKDIMKEFKLDGKEYAELDTKEKLRSICKWYDKEKTRRAIFDALSKPIL